MFRTCIKNRIDLEYGKMPQDGIVPGSRRALAGTEVEECLSIRKQKQRSAAFVPRKRFKWYERVMETCFVRGKRFRRNESRLQDGAQAVGDTFQSFIQKFARTCQVDADEALSRFAVH